MSLTFARSAANKLVERQRCAMGQEGEARFFLALLFYSLIRLRLMLQPKTCVSGVLTGCPARRHSTASFMYETLPFSSGAPLYRKNPF